MKIKALIPAALIAIVGSSSLAMARPILTAEASWSWSTKPAPVVVRDHRTPVKPAPVVGYWNRRDDIRWDRDYSDYYAPRFSVLEEGIQFGYTEYRHDLLLLGKRFSTLRIDNDGGSSYLMKVVVEFSDNSVQQIDLGRTLRGNQSLTLPLNFRNKAINRVFIYRADGGEAANMRQYHNGSFTVSAQ